MFLQHGVAGCAGAGAATGIATAGMSYVQIPGATISGLPSIDTFCGDFLSSFVTNGVISSAVIGKLFGKAITHLHYLPLKYDISLINYINSYI